MQAVLVVEQPRPRKPWAPCIWRKPVRPVNPQICDTNTTAPLSEFAGKADPEEEAYIAATRNQQQQVNARVQALVDWDKLMKTIPAGINNQQIAAFLLQPQVSKILAAELGNAPDIKTAIIQTVSTPEYQLC